MKYANDLRQRVSKCLLTSKLKNEKFTLTFDESSLQNKRYININIHGKESLWNPGLVRISIFVVKKIYIRLVMDQKVLKYD